MILLTSGQTLTAGLPSLLSNRTYCFNPIKPTKHRNYPRILNHAPTLALPCLNRLPGGQNPWLSAAKCAMLTVGRDPHFLHLSFIPPITSTLLSTLASGGADHSTSPALVDTATCVSL